MSIIQIAILIVVLVAVAAIVFWFLRRSGLSIPEPIMIAIWAIVAILAILLIANLAGLGPPVIIR